MRRIDLPIEAQGTLCVLCEASGEHVTARLLDREGAPVCYPHFAFLLRLEAVLRVAAREEQDALIATGRAGFNCGGIRS